jgi:hypothetical protein
MRKKLKILGIIIFVMASIGAWCQTNPKSSCKIVDDRLVFTYNLKWNENQKKEFVDLFDVDSIVLVNAIKGLPEFNANGIAWKSKKISATVIEFSKSLDEGSAIQQTVDNIKLQTNVHNTYEEGALFAYHGVNRFDNDDAFIYKNGVAQFFLPNHAGAKKVYLSGSFNSWSTMKTPMQKIDNGWVINIKLQPGKYTYKFIVDGRWMHDPSNKQRERNEHGSYNSVVFCYNYKFSLNAYPTAKKVILAGSFNNWNTGELVMNKTKDGWELPMYLREGTHAYKFIVDNNWILDPSNKVTRPDGKGNINSFVGIGNLYTFKLKGYLTAERVFLAGNFNVWNANELQMQKIDYGWYLPYNLPSGNYEYKFVVDGKWTVDPDKPYTVGNGDLTNSILAVNPNYTFKIDGFNDAKTVMISGSFNGWNHDGYRMKKINNGWEISLFLKPGKYTYKLVVDGNWVLDPGNKLWEQNEFGTGNSVVWINN